MKRVADASDGTLKDLFASLQEGEEIEIDHRNGRLFRVTKANGKFQVTEIPRT